MDVLGPVSSEPGFLYQVDIDVVAAHRMNDAFKFEFIFRALEVLGEDVVKSFLWSFFWGCLQGWLRVSVG